MAAVEPRSGMAAPAAGPTRAVRLHGSRDYYLIGRGRTFAIQSGQPGITMAQRRHPGRQRAANLAADQVAIPFLFLQLTWFSK